VTITVITISHLSSPPIVPNVKCIAWNFDGSNIWNSEKLKFENGDIIPNVESYFK
jgi:hypothetical protein